MTADINALKKACLIRIVDDDEAHCSAMAFLLECRGWRTVVYHSAADYLQNDAPSVPGVLILDVHMPGMTGLELQSAMKERSIRTPIIFLTGYGDIDMAVHSLHEGADDFLTKPVKAERLTAAVEKSAERDVLAQDPLAALTPVSAREKLALLSERELQILKLTALGLKSPAVGARLGISERTVQAHKGSALKKLQLHSTDEVLRLLKTAELSEHHF